MAFESSDDLKKLLKRKKTAVGFIPMSEHKNKTHIFMIFDSFNKEFNKAHPFSTLCGIRVPDFIHDDKAKVDCKRCLKMKESGELPDEKTPTFKDADNMEKVMNLLKGMDVDDAVKRRLVTQHKSVLKSVKKLTKK
ncbi:hypothetical protein HQ545_05385 [Candidatus Woesearchaeota archaeon]|nr:hypothetical protein [Candidatus Woesearchaeota archaeon]